MIAGFTHLTFDCYGTLIDWEKGILEALKPLLHRAGTQVRPEDVLQSFAGHEARIESQNWRPYRDVLREVLAAMAADFNLVLLNSEKYLLSASLPDWPPFPDTVQGLKQLAMKFRLVIVSNTNDALFAETQKQLGVQFNDVITAEQVKSYKPAKAPFHEVLRRVNAPVSRILHVAQSLYHDHAPAQQPGLRTAWIRRPSRLAGTGLAPKARIKPDFIFNDLPGLVAALGESGF
jgi:2-haloacid dehalogenase